MNFFRNRWEAVRKFSFPLVLLLLVSAGMGTGQAQLSIMPLGDSITKGGGIGNDGLDASGNYYLQSGYRSQLYSDLVSDNVSFNFVGANTYHATAALTAVGEEYANGYGSYTLDGIYENLAADTPEGGDDNVGGYWLTGGGTGRSAVDPNIVLLMGGTNDLEQGFSLTTMETSMNNILSWFKTNRPSTTLIVSTVMPILGNASANITGTAFNSWLETTEVPAYSDTQLIDLGGLFGANESTYYSTDGVHPNAAGYNAMGDAWAAAIKTNVVPEPNGGYLLLTGFAGCAVAFRRQILSRKSS